MDRKTIFAKQRQTPPRHLERTSTATSYFELIFISRRPSMVRPHTVPYHSETQLLSLSLLRNLGLFNMWYDKKDKMAF